MKVFKTQKNKPIVWTWIALLVMLVGGVGGVLAYLLSAPPPVQNVFIPATVTCRVEETFDGVVKEDVCVRNTGNVDAFIRVAVIANWVSEKDGTVLATAPIEGVDYTVEWAVNGWKKRNDGFWYHLRSVVPNALTDSLIKRAEATDAPRGYRLEIQLLATALQANPTTAVEQQWGITVVGGMLAFS